MSGQPNDYEVFCHMILSWYCHNYSCGWRDSFTVIGTFFNRLLTKKEYKRSRLFVTESEKLQVWSSLRQKPDYFGSKAMAATASGRTIEPLHEIKTTKTIMVFRCFLVKISKLVWENNLIKLRINMYYKNLRASDPQPFCCIILGRLMHWSVTEQTWNYRT